MQKKIKKPINICPDLKRKFKSLCSEKGLFMSTEVEGYIKEKMQKLDHKSDINDSLLLKNLTKELSDDNS